MIDGLGAFDKGGTAGVDLPEIGGVGRKVG